MEKKHYSINSLMDIIVQAVQQSKAQHTFFLESMFILPSAINVFQQDNKDSLSLKIKLFLGDKQLSHFPLQQWKKFQGVMINPRLNNSLIFSIWSTGAAADMDYKNPIWE